MLKYVFFPFFSFIRCCVFRRVAEHGEYCEKDPLSASKKESQRHSDNVIPPNKGAGAETTFILLLV